MGGNLGAPSETEAGSLDRAFRFYDRRRTAGGDADNHRSGIPVGSLSDLVGDREWIRP